MAIIKSQKFILLLKKRNYFRGLFLLAWFLIMLIPELITAESIPHGLRAVGAIPGAFIILVKKKFNRFNEEIMRVYEY